MTGERGIGAVIRHHRELAQLSLRQLSALAQVSNPYLSQIERGLHEPSVRVVRRVARALGISAEELLERAGLLDDGVISRFGFVLHHRALGFVANAMAVWDVPSRWASRRVLG